MRFGRRPASPSGVRSGHTVGHWVMLCINIVVITACFVGAGALLFAKRTLDNAPVTADPVLPTQTTRPLTPTTPPSTTPGEPIDTSPSTTPETFPPADPQARNFLITGSDANACVDPNSQWASAADPSRPGGQRTDTIMVMRVDPGNKRAAILSFPRDLWVKVPGRRAEQRINGTYTPGDPQLLIETIFLNFGVAIDYYIQVDFCAFKRIVDAVGGVTVPFDTPIKDDPGSSDNAGTGLFVPEAGCHTFGGDEALAYVRSRYMRYQDADGTWRQDTSYDLGRIARQQDFLWRTLDAALDKGLLDPAVARGLFDTFNEDVFRSQSLTVDVMLQFVGVLRSVDPESIATYQIAVSRLLLPNADVLEPELGSENMKAILAIFRGEASLTTAPEQTVITDPDADPDTDPDTGAETVPGTVPASSTSLPLQPTSTDPEERPVNGAILPSSTIDC